MKPVLSNGNAGPTLAGMPASTASATGGEPGLPKERDGGGGPVLPRSQFVLGVFHDPAALREAILSLRATSDLDLGQLLLVVRALPNAEPAAPSHAGINTCHLEMEARNDDLLRQALAAEPPFAPLWESMRARSKPFDGAHPRIYTQLIHHLASGAAVLVVRVHRDDQQRRTARALLDSRCDILLTQEVSIRSD